MAKYNIRRIYSPNIIIFGESTRRIIIFFIFVSKELNMIQRQLLPILKRLMNTGKAIVLIGARQTGKTTLLKELSKEGKTSNG